MADDEATDATFASTTNFLEPQKEHPADESGEINTRKINDEAQHASTVVRFAADRLLEFLSTASNEKLGACLVGLGAVTYAVLGRVGLILIGVVGGVALHASWDGSRNGSQRGGDDAAEAHRRREIGMDVVHRILDWREKRTLDEDLLNENIQRTSPVSDYSEFRSETAEALNALTDAVIRDYVKWWYSPILPADIAFPTACRRTFTNFILSLSSHLRRKRHADAFLDFTTNSSSIFIVVLNEVSTAIAASPQATIPDAIATYLRLKPQCNLANIMDEQHQKRKLLMVADDILESFLDQNIYRCAPARIFLREILANVVLDGTINTCSKSDWINDWIVYLLEDSEPELMTAIDAGVVDSAAQEISSIGQTDAVQKDSPESAVALARTQASENHKRTLSRAEEAMEEAMKEAQRLTQLMADEDARRLQEQNGSTANVSDDVSESTGRGVQTPTSSQSGVNGDEERAIQEGTMQDSGDERGALNVSESTTSFTSFDQLPASQVPAHISEEAPETQQAHPDALTLYKAKVSIFDDGGPADRRPIKSKPLIDYMIQIEPLSSSFRGWMIVRTYTDFETLHEVLSRIAKVGGIPFHEAHVSLPSWKGSTKATLRDELERYLLDALSFEGLAESEGMKRFLEKDRGLTRSPGAKGGFWPTQAFETMGKGMVDVLTTVPKGVAGGGKAVIGGVAGGGKAVIGGVSNVLGGGANPANKKPAFPGATIARQSTSSLTDSGRVSTASSVTDLTRQSSEVTRKPSPPSANGTRPSLDTHWSSSPGEKRNRIVRYSSPPTSVLEDEQSSKSQNQTPEIQLPPLPTEVPDDYVSSPKPPRPKIELPPHTSHISVDGTSFFDMPTPSPARSPASITSSIKEEGPLKPSRRRPQSQPRPKVNKQPISEQEAQVTVELLFAVINELYTLSSAWQIRRTLLTAAKTFLLRPGNPQLENIRILLQETLLDANTSDSGIAVHLYKLRENSLPTEEELAKWPPPLNEKQSEALRKKARKLLVERGMPQALTSVMGMAASGEALGKLFDCLQIEEVARGLIFGLMLQSIRAVTQ